MKFLSKILQFAQNNVSIIMILYIPTEYGPAQKINFFLV